MAWALVQAPDVPPQCVSLLIGLANHADSRGRGAYAGQKLLAGYARKSDRSVRNDLDVLLERGIIRRGDQSLAGHIPADCRPVVYDLAMERKQTSGRKQTSARQQASAATSDRLTEPQASDQEERGGSGSTVPAGSELPAGSTEQRERKQASDKPTTNQNQDSPTESPRRRDLNEGREDVMQLCVHLADRIERNTGERPTIGKNWLDAARLMLDNDKRRPDQIHRAIDWCQDDAFWYSRILSMPKLREKYITLREQAEGRRKQQGNGHAGMQGGARQPLANAEEAALLKPEDIV